MESVILPEGCKTVINHFFSLCLSQKKQQPLFCCCSCLEVRSIMEWIQLAFANGRWEISSFSLHHGDDIFFAYLWIFAIVSKTLFSKKYFSSALLGSFLCILSSWLFKSKQVVVSCDFSTSYLFCQCLSENYSSVIKRNSLLWHESAMFF